MMDTFSCASKEIKCVKPPRAAWLAMLLDHADQVQTMELADFTIELRDRGLRSVMIDAVLGYMVHIGWVEIWQPSGPSDECWISAVTDAGSLAG